MNTIQHAVRQKDRKKFNVLLKRTKSGSRKRACDMFAEWVALKNYRQSIVNRPGWGLESYILNNVASWEALPKKKRNAADSAVRYFNDAALKKVQSSAQHVGRQLK